MNTNLSTENPDDINQDLLNNMSDEEKNAFVLKYLKNFRLNMNTDVFERMLSNGVSPNLTTPEGKSLLMIAAEKGSIELVQTLLDANADVRLKDRQGRTALFYAINAENENSDVVSLLLNQGAEPNAEISEGKTPLLRAVEKGHCQIVKVLLEKGGNIYDTVEGTGDTALHLAIKNGNKAMVQLLLGQNPNLNTKNRKQLTPIDLCQGNSELLEMIQPFRAKQATPDSNLLHLQNQNQRKNSPEASQQFEGQLQGKQTDEDTQEGQQSQTQSLEQSSEVSKAQQKQAPQEYRRYQQQQQQLQQKKSPQHVQQKMEKDPPRKYAGKTDMNMRRTISNNEVPQRETFNLDTNVNKANENITTSSGNVIVSPSTGVTNVTNNSEAPQSARELGQSYNLGTSLQGQAEDSSGYLASPYANKPNDYGKFTENNNQYQVQGKQPQGKRINVPEVSNAPEMTGATIRPDKFQQDKDSAPMIAKTPSNDYINQYHTQQQQMQAGYMGNAAPNQMGFNPAQMKGNMSPGFYGNQYMAPSPNAGGNAQQYQKKKPKNQINTATTAKGFGMNNSVNMGQPQNQGQNNQAQNQYNRGNIEAGNMTGGNMGGNMGGANMPGGNMGGGNIGGGRSDQGFQPRNQNNQGNPKFQKGMDRNFQDNTAMPPRGFTHPGYQYPNMGMPQNMADVPDMQKMTTEIPQGKVPVSNRIIEEGNKDPKGGRSQQQQQQYIQQQQQQQILQQGNMMFPGNNLLSPTNFIIDSRNMMPNIPGQNPMMFTSHYPQAPQANMAMMNNVGQAIPQNNYMPVNYSPSMTSMRNQQMMPKSPMQSPFTYPNGAQPNPGHPADPKVVYFNFNDPMLTENMKLAANVQSIYKGITDQKQDIEKIKLENKDLKTELETRQIKEKALQDKSKDKDKEIEELKKEIEELENISKAMSAKASFVNRQDVSVETDGLLDNFQYAPLEGILQESKPNVEFWKHEQLINALHEEVLAFEKCVDNYNQEKKALFDSLINLIHQAVGEVIPDTEFYIYGSFATGLSLPWSDIDIVIKTQNNYYTNGVLLDQIDSNLRKKKWVDDIKIIKNTSVPVLKITCSKGTYASKKVDISLHDPRHNGLACVDLVKQYIERYPALRPLVLVLKQFLYKLNLNDTYSGGLSSYGLILMVVFLFQTKEMSNGTNLLANQNLGSLLMSFFSLYGFEFDYYTQFVVNPSKNPNDMNDVYVANANIMNMVNQNPPSMMEPKIIIQDPLSLGNNVGRSTFQIKQIKSAFMAAFFEASKPCICEVHKFIGEIDTIDGKKPVHKCASIFRRMLLAYAPQK